MWSFWRSVLDILRSHYLRQSDYQGEHSNLLGYRDIQSGAFGYVNGHRKSTSETISNPNKINDVLPAAGGLLQDYLSTQRQKFHANEGDTVVSTSLLARIWNVVLILMLLGFLKSIIESCVQQRLKRLDDVKVREFEDKLQVEAESSTQQS